MANPQDPSGRTLHSPPAHSPALVATRAASIGKQPNISYATSKGLSNGVSRLGERRSRPSRTNANWGQSPRRPAFDRCLHNQDWRRSRKLVIEETFLRRSFVDGSGMHAALSSVERISMDGRLPAQPRSFAAMTNGGQCGQPGECRPCEKPSIPRSLEAHRHPVSLHARPCFFFFKERMTQLT